MKSRWLLLGSLLAWLFSCGLQGAAGQMIEQDANGKRIVYSKFFDGADWLAEGELGLSVVVDNDTPIGRQIFGSLTGKDSDGVGTVTLYFWNLTATQRSAEAIRVVCGENPLEYPGAVTIGPGPFARSGQKIGTVPFFAYARELVATVSLTIDGTPITRKITAKRRTVPELKKYFGKGGLPPYPWFSEEYSVDALKAKAGKK